jgi:hypothetical protein
MTSRACRLATVRCVATNHQEGIVMSKAICALKAALGVRGNFCHIGSWRWVLYHNI